MKSSEQVQEALDARAKKVYPADPTYAGLNVGNAVESLLESLENRRVIYHGIEYITGTVEGSQVELYLPGEENFDHIADVSLVDFVY